jgi:hypothetical protein
MSDARNTIIPAKAGAAIMVREGETLRVIDVEGFQVADFICFNEHDHGCFLSAGKTRMNAFKVRISTGDRLFSNRNEVMFTITKDTVGAHDLLFPPCNRWLYENVFDQPGKTGCLEILTGVLTPYGIDEGAVPDPFNLFMKTHVEPDNDLVIDLPDSRAGDHIELTAEMDCLVAVTACPEESSQCNGGRSTAIELQMVD